MRWLGIVASKQIETMSVFGRKGYLFQFHNRVIKCQLKKPLRVFHPDFDIGLRFHLERVLKHKEA